MQDFPFHTGPCHNFGCNDQGYETEISSGTACECTCYDGYSGDHCEVEG